MKHCILLVLFFLSFSSITAQQKIPYAKYCKVNNELVYLEYYNNQGKIIQKSHYKPQIDDYYSYDLDGTFTGSIHVMNSFQDTVYYMHRYYRDGANEEVWYKHKKEKYLLSQIQHYQDSTYKYQYAENKTRLYLEKKYFTPEKKVKRITKIYYPELKKEEKLYCYNDDNAMSAAFVILDSDTISKTFYTYNKRETIIEKYQDSFLIWKNRKIFNRKNQLKKEYFYDKQGLITRIIKYSYNKYGYIEKEVDLNLLYNEDFGEEKKQITEYIYYYIEK
jgi:hypothetical protein